MKNVFKKMFATMALALAFSGAAYADKDTPITLKQLPTRAQILLRSNFKGKKVSFSKKDSDLFGRTFDVIFTNGDKVEFDRDGNWTSISCRRGRRCQPDWCLLPFCVMCATAIVRFISWTLTVRRISTKLNCQTAWNSPSISMVN